MDKKNSQTSQDLLNTDEYSSIDNVEIEAAEIKALDQPKHKKVKGFAAPLGLTIMILTVLGFFTVVSIISSFMGFVLDNSPKREQYNGFLAPLVMLDPPNFDNPSHLDASFLVQTSIWSIIMDPNRSVIYPTDDSGRTIIPATDVDVQCTKLYGPGLIIPRASMAADGGEVTNISEYDGVVFEYIPASESFAVPIMGEVGLYQPQVESISKKGDLIYLKTGYIPIESSWIDNVNKKQNKDAVIKYKVFILQNDKKTNQTYIVKLKDEDIDLS